MTLSASASEQSSSRSQKVGNSLRDKQWTPAGAGPRVHERIKTKKY